MKLYEYWLGLYPLDWEFCFNIRSYGDRFCPKPVY